MVKKVAVLAPNPVNGCGLFQYLEAFFENKIPYRTFAVAETNQVQTNSGITITLDDVVSNLKGHENEYEAVIFSCGDAFMKFHENAGKAYNQALLEILKIFGEQKKILIGHCASAIIYENAGVADGKKVAVHPYGKAYLKKAIGTDDKFTIDGNFYTAQTENTIAFLIPEILKILK
jgi:transcriptional regulator GlxA family with amidase domain